jgi:hypothetical protein
VTEFTLKDGLRFGEKLPDERGDPRSAQSFYNLTHACFFVLIGAPTIHAASAENPCSVMPDAIIVTRSKFVRGFDAASCCVFKERSFKTPSGGLLSAHVRPLLQVYEYNLILILLWLKKTRESRSQSSFAFLRPSKRRRKGIKLAGR